MASLEAPPVKRRFYSQLVIPLVWAAITGFGIYLSPDKHGHGTHQQLGLPPCPSVIFFNRPCPGCGLTTSWTATIHGRFIEAFQAHPLGPFLYLALTGIALAYLMAFFRGERLNTDTHKFTRWVMGGAIVFFTFGILRFILTPNYAAPREIENFVQRTAVLRGK